MSFGKLLGDLDDDDCRAILVAPQSELWSSCTNVSQLIVFHCNALERANLAQVTWGHIQTLACSTLTHFDGRQNKDIHRCPVHESRL